MKVLITCFVLLFTINSINAQEGYPRPTGDDIVFYIQHNRGKNAFVYRPNFLKKGELNEINPLKIHRQVFDNKGEIVPLTAIQRKFAYGIKSSKIAENTFEIRLVSYDDQKLILKVDDNGEAYIETIINGKYMIVKHLFIYQKEGTSGLKTKVEKITFYGIDKNKRPIKSDLLINT